MCMHWYAPECESHLGRSLKEVMSFPISRLRGADMPSSCHTYMLLCWEPAGTLQCEQASSMTTLQTALSALNAGLTGSASKHAAPCQILSRFALASDILSDRLKCRLLSFE